MLQRPESVQFLVRGIALWHFSVRSFQGLVVITTYDTEFYAVVRAVRHWRDYLFHREFIIFFLSRGLMSFGYTRQNLSSRYASWVAYVERFTFALKHRWGTSNWVADAFIHRALVISDLRVSIPCLELLCEAYADDLFFAMILSRMATGEHLDFVLVDGFLFKGTHPCIPDTSLHL